jgi:hypothetical protein
MVYGVRTTGERSATRPAAPLAAAPARGAHLWRRPGCARAYAHARISGAITRSEQQNQSSGQNSRPGRPHPGSGSGRHALRTETAPDCQIQDCHWRIRRYGCRYDRGPRRAGPVDRPPARSSAADFCPCTTRLRCRCARARPGCGPASCAAGARPPPLSGGSDHIDHDHRNIVATATVQRDLQQLVGDDLDRRVIHRPLQNVECGVFGKPV